MMAAMIQPSQSSYSSTSMASQIPKTSTPIDPMPMSASPTLEILNMRTTSLGTLRLRPPRIRYVKRTSAETSANAVAMWRNRSQS